MGKRRAQASRRAVLRLLDANRNRALEGVRVCEEIVRLHFELPGMWRRLRSLRHGIARDVGRLPVTPLDLVRARESQRDVGRRAPSTSVDSLQRLLLINFQRVKESLRTLEECARLFGPRHAAAFQRLRFSTYATERDLLILLDALRHP
jgi:thiamine-phosphate pyrophosphorylase